MRLIATASDIIAAAQAAAPRLPIGSADGAAMPPTIDGNGRMHAPRDGYEINGTVYRGGEYIGESGGTPRIRKIKATAAAAERIAAALGGECGREFGGNRIVYTPLTEGQWAAVVAVLPIEKAMVLAADAEGLPHGKAFKFSYRRWLEQRARNHDFDEAWCDGIGADKQGKLVCYVYGQIIDR